ncbi:MAG: stage III sporulation protein AE [Lachnospiraceae bacterium]|nr:stage III sporulation protein AE [Lachnospiraceae bacterium]
MKKKIGKSICFIGIVCAALWIGIASMGSKKIVSASTQRDIFAENEEEPGVSEIADIYLSELDFDELSRRAQSGGMAEEEFPELVKQLVQGEEVLSVTGLFERLKRYFFANVSKSAVSFWELIAIGIVGSIFTVLSKSISIRQTSETGFYIAYLLLVAVLTVSYGKIAGIAESALQSTTEFTRALAPVFFVCVTAASGSASANVFYQFTIFLIAAVQEVLLGIVLPLSKVYFAVSIANYVSQRDMLSRLLRLFETIVKWLLRGLLGICVSYNFVQSLVVPAADRLQKNILIRSVGAIPGIGNKLAGVWQTMLGSGVLVKNAVGTAGILVLIGIVFAPSVKIFVSQLMYRLGAAFLQPVADKRMIRCVESSAVAVNLLFQSVICSAVLIVLSLAIVMSATNGMI